MTITENNAVVGDVDKVEDAGNATRTAGSAVGNVSRTARQYGPYVEANWGFANHWYPGVFSHEVEARGVVGTRIGGHDIAVTRSDDGSAYAIADRCLHRGVKLSAKPTCFADKKITCWYHGFTYNTENGNLDTIVGAPNDPLINTISVRTYPTEEYGGIIWVFVGDEDFGEPPALVEDLPMKVDDAPIPHLMDPDFIGAGIRREAKGNWRPAVENGLDPSHLLVHWDNAIVLATDRFLPLGVNALTDDATELIDIEGGPKGVRNRYDLPEKYDAVAENPMLGVKAKGSIPMPYRASAWLPCGMMIEPWPQPGHVQYEFMVPIDDHTHMYWEIIGTSAATEEEREEFRFRYEHYYEPLAIRGFNDNDLFAREQTEDFYQKYDGWNNEIFAHADFSVVQWRKHASKFGRGFFESPYSVDEF